MYLQPKTKTFLEVMFFTAFQSIDKQCKSEDAREKLMVVFSKTKDIPQLTTGLLYFIPKTLMSSNLSNTPKAKRALKRNCRLAVDALGILDTVS
jgi:nucleolar MIF4G domain-containing protein 1